jgi:hypothetical protein
MGLPYQKKQYTGMNRLLPVDHEASHGIAQKCVTPSGQLVLLSDNKFISSIRIFTNIYPVWIRDMIDPVVKKFEKMLAERAYRYIIMLR